MTNDQPITLKRDCAAVMVPSGEKVSLPAGTRVWITQSHGGSHTVMTDRGYMVCLDRRDSDALGLEDASEAGAAETRTFQNVEEAKAQVWNQLQTCFDPEIPVNIVELGLIYDCAVEPLAGGGYKASVRFTLTAQGCGMGEFLREHIKGKLLALPGIYQAEVTLVWDPPWNQNMMSGAAKQQLGIE